MLAYRAFDMEPGFEDELNPVLKCPCGHIFSPVDTEALRTGIRLRGLASVA